MTPTGDLPETVLEVVTTGLVVGTGLHGVCAGYEDGEWRHKQLSNDLVAWATDWILTDEEKRSFTLANQIVLLEKALHRIYETEKYQNRGEIGELLLHIFQRRFLKSDRAITRMYFKDANNDTVKGFDGVHIIESSSGELELWLGESKFHTSAQVAKYEVFKSLEEHLRQDYLRKEFAAVCDKLPKDSPHYQMVTDLLNRKVTLDKIFTRVVIPVFISYESATVELHSESTAYYLQEIEAELQAEWKDFCDYFTRKTLPRSVRMHLILFPMRSKELLTQAFDERLKAWQVLTRT